jgi:hypothetical protein
MGAATTLASVIAAAVGGVALYRFLERRRRDVDELLKGANARADDRCEAHIIDYERDPESGVFRPKA